jgi:hypothetical protein
LNSHIFPPAAYLPLFDFVGIGSQGRRDRRWCKPGQFEGGVM